MPALFSGETASAGLSVLMILAKATIVLLAALGVTRAMERGSAVSRHLVWFVSLGALLLIPALASWSPIRLAILPPATGLSELGAPTMAAPTIAAPSVPVGTPSTAPTVGASGAPTGSGPSTSTSARNV